MTAVRTGRILVAAGLGVATSLGVAWSGLSFGVRGASSETRWHGPRGHDWLVRMWPGLTVDVGIVSLEMPAAAAGQKAEVDGDVLRLVPHAPWREMVKGSIERATGGAFWELRAFGWPCKCVAAGYLAMPTQSRGQPIGWWTVRLPWSGRSRELAAMPIWSGLAANAAVFAAPWWVGLAAGGAGMRQVVRRLRMRRGRCPVCAYDLRGEFSGGCPECGWMRDAASART